MSLDPETNKVGLNAIARAHALLDICADLVAEVKRSNHSPSWKLAGLVYEAERALWMREKDLDTLQLLYEAMSGGIRKV